MFFTLFPHELGMTLSFVLFCFVLFLALFFLLFACFVFFSTFECLYFVIESRARTHNKGNIEMCACTKILQLFGLYLDPLFTRVCSVDQPKCRIKSQHSTFISDRGGDGDEMTAKQKTSVQDGVSTSVWNHLGFYNQMSGHFLSWVNGQRTRQAKTWSFPCPTLQKTAALSLASKFDTFPHSKIVTQQVLSSGTHITWKDGTPWQH